MILLVPSVKGGYYNDTMLYSSGLNSNISIIYPINVSYFIVDSDFIYLGNLSSSNINEVSNEFVTLNFTENNKFYYASSLPYYSSSNDHHKFITSGFANGLEGSYLFNVSTCDLKEMRYIPYGGSSLSLSPSDWDCNNNVVDLPVTSINKGVNKLYIGYNLSIFKCTNGTKALNFNVFDEDLITTPLIADAELVAEYWNNDYYLYNYSTTYDNSSVYSLCIYPAYQEINADIYIKYTTSGGYSHRYYLNNISLTNSTQNVSIYNFNTTATTTTLKANVFDENYNYNPNRYTKLLRYYPGEDVWRTVQMDKSDEFGRTYYHIKQQNTEYKLEFWDYTTYLLRTDELKFYCPTTEDCIINNIVPNEDDGSGTFNYYSYTYNETTQVFTLSWNDPTSATSSITLQAFTEAYDGRVYWCDTTISTPSGSINCDLSASSGTVFITAYRSASPNEAFFLTTIEDITKFLYDQFAASGLTNDALIIAGLLAMVIILAGVITHPGSLVLTGPLALIILMVFGLTNFITLSFITLASIMAIVLGLLIKK